jgi:hypothetical protein
LVITEDEAEFASLAFADAAAIVAFVFENAALAMLLVLVRVVPAMASALA